MSFSCRIKKNGETMLFGQIFKLYVTLSPMRIILSQWVVAQGENLVGYMMQSFIKQ